MNWNVRIGINPIGWMNDDLPELGGDTPLDTALREGAEIGYEGFELGNKFPKTGPALKAKLDEFGMACVSGWYSGMLAEIPEGMSNWQVIDAEMANCVAHMEKLAYNGAKVVVYGECAGTVQGQIATPVGRRPRFTSDEQWNSYAMRLNTFGEHIKKQYGITLAYHHHMGAYVESPDEVDRLMALTEPQHVGLLFDTGHAFFGGAGDPLVPLKRHLSRVVHVHCKDVRPAVISRARNEGWSFLTSVLNGAFTVPGDGAIDFGGVLRTLKEGGYEGWLVVEAEQDPAVAPSYAYGKKGYETLRGLVDQINQEV